MDALKAETESDSRGQHNGYEKEINDLLIDIPNRNISSPKKRPSLNFKDVINNKNVTNSVGCDSRKSESPSAKSKLKSKTLLIDGGSSPNQRPHKKRKRYLSNPVNKTNALLNSPINPNEIPNQTRSPSSAVKRKRRRSASLSIDNSNNSPKENKNNENLPVHTKAKIPLIFDKNASSPQKTFRTPPKRIRALSGSENDVKGSQVSPKVCVATNCISPSNKGPLSTTIWRWSPIRGKFKPKSIEYQNGAVVEHQEDDEALMASSFKSKWQSVS